RQLFDVANGRPASQLADARDPGVVMVRLDEGQPVAQHGLEIAGDRDVGLDVLVQLRRIDVDVDLFRVRRVRRELAGDAIVEAHAEGDQQVRLLDRLVYPVLAVHAHNAQVERAI